MKKFIFLFIFLFFSKLYAIDVLNTFMTIPLGADKETLINIFKDKNYKFNETENLININCSNIKFKGYPVTSYEVLFNYDGSRILSINLKLLEFEEKTGGFSGFEWEVLSFYTQKYERLYFYSLYNEFNSDKETKYVFNDFIGTRIIHVIHEMPDKIFCEVKVIPSENMKYSDYKKIQLPLDLMMGKDKQECIEILINNGFKTNKKKLNKDKLFFTNKNNYKIKNLDAALYDIEITFNNNKIHELTLIIFENTNFMTKTSQYIDFFSKENQLLKNIYYDDKDYYENYFNEDNSFRMSYSGNSNYYKRIRFTDLTN